MPPSSRSELVAAMPREAALRLQPDLAVSTVAIGSLALVLAPEQTVTGLRARLAGNAPKIAVQRLVVRQKLLESLHAAGCVLPARPGQVIETGLAEAAIAANAAPLAEALAAVSDRAQHQISISWSPPEALRRFASEPELAGRSDPREIAEGAAALGARLGADFTRRLMDNALDSIMLPLEPGPQMLSNLAVLLPRDDTAEFEAELEAIDAIWSEGLSIRMIGPGPAISFAAFELVAPGPAARAARRRLGLGTDPTEQQVRAALRARALEGESGADLTEAADLMRRLARGREAVRAAGLEVRDEGLPLIRFLRDGDAPSTTLGTMREPAEALA